MSSPGSSWLLGVLPALDVAALSSERRWKVGARVTADLTPSAPRGPTWLLLTPARTGARLPHVLCDPVADCCKAHPG